LEYETCGVCIAIDGIAGKTGQTGEDSGKVVAQAVSSSAGNMTLRSRKIRHRIHKWIGIACGIGIGPTKTLASAGLAGEQRQWSMKQERRTPGYTTDWDGLALVRA
jgi:hypothetical protein